MTTSQKFNVTAEIQYKLKLDKDNSFCSVQDWQNLPQQKFDRVLHVLEEDDNESLALKNLMSVCNPEGLVLVCNVPQTNKRLSNGTLKKNKDVLAKVMKEEGNERYWFFETTRGMFDLLVEAKR